MNLVERSVRRKRVYRGIAVDFWVDTVRLPSGNLATREYLGHPGAVAVVAVAAPQGTPTLVVVRPDRLLPLAQAPPAPLA